MPWTLCVVAASPTVPPLHSEHFKPCHEKDLAYCLNGGECFVIETLSGPHKHCNLSSVTSVFLSLFLSFLLPGTSDHLGIEFMESKAVYKRQVLSITSIAMAISLLGTMCMALYCRNKEKLQAHLKESRSLKSYTTNPINLLEAKMRVPNTNLQMHEVIFVLFHVLKQKTNQTQLIILTKCIMCLSSPEQRTRSAHWSTSRRTPPVARGRLNPIGGSKFSESECLAPSVPPHPFVFICSPESGWKQGGFTLLSSHSVTMWLKGNAQAGALRDTEHLPTSPGLLVTPALNNRISFFLIVVA
uniref:Uncharacterized protein n=1 Tax=Xiphophorus couchianus TaxID=32473 RepID=A0A3B5M3L3_9TELE